MRSTAGAGRIGPHSTTLTRALRVAKGAPFLCRLTQRIARWMSTRTPIAQPSCTRSARRPLVLPLRRALCDALHRCTDAADRLLRMLRWAASLFKIQPDQGVGWLLDGK